MERNGVGWVGGLMVVVEPDGLNKHVTGIGLAASSLGASKRDWHQPSPHQAAQHNEPQSVLVRVLLQEVGVDDEDGVQPLRAIRRCEERRVVVQPQAL